MGFMKGESQMAEIGKTATTRPSAVARGGAASSAGRLSELRRRVSSGDGAPLTASELAHLCHVETRIVHAWAAKGRLPSFRTPGQHLRFQLADVASFLKRQGNTGGAETLVLCEPERRRLLRRRLTRVGVEWHTDPLTLLVAVGRSQPNRVVIDPAALGSLEPKTVIGVLTKALPRLEIMWLGDLPTSCSGSHVASVDERQLS